MPRGDLRRRWALECEAAPHSQLTARHGGSVGKKGYGEGRGGGAGRAGVLGHHRESHSSAACRKGGQRARSKSPIESGMRNKIEVEREQQIKVLRRIRKGFLNLLQYAKIDVIGLGFAFPVQASPGASKSIRISYTYK